MLDCVTKKLSNSSAGERRVFYLKESGRTGGKREKGQ